MDGKDTLWRSERGSEVLIWLPPDKEVESAMGCSMVGRSNTFANNEQDVALAALQPLPRDLQPSEKEHAW